MQAGGVLPDVPGPELVAPRPAAGAQQHGVTGGNLDARLFLPRFEILDVERGARLEIGQVAQARDVDQDAARDDAVFQVLDAELRAALFGVDVSARIPVVSLVLV